MKPLKWFKDPYNQNLLVNWGIRLALAFFVLHVVITITDDLIIIGGTGLVLGVLLKMSTRW